MNPNRVRFKQPVNPEKARARAKGLPPRGDLNLLQDLRDNDPKCACGKERFYSKEAAEAGLSALMARRIIQLGEVSEREVYECKVAGRELHESIWHLTSNIGWYKNTSVKEKEAERQAGRGKI